MKTLALLVGFVLIAGITYAQHYKHPLKQQNKSKENITTQVADINSYKSPIKVGLKVKPLQITFGTKLVTYKHTTIPTLGDSELWKFIKIIQRGTIYGI